MKIPPETYQLISGLPGQELIHPGLNDLERGEYSSPEALLILIARSRLARAGLGFLEMLKPTQENVESLLYQVSRQIRSRPIASTTASRGGWIVLFEAWNNANYGLNLTRLGSGTIIDRRRTTSD